MARVGILVDGDSLRSDKYISLWDLGLSWQAITETWQEEKIQFKTQNLTEEVSNAAVLIIFSFLKRLIMGPLPNPWPKVYWTFEFEGVFSQRISLRRDSVDEPAARHRAAHPGPGPQPRAPPGCGHHHKQPHWQPRRPGVGEAGGIFCNDFISKQACFK